MNCLFLVIANILSQNYVSADGFFKRPFTDLYIDQSSKKEAVSSLENSKGTYSDTPLEEPVYITNIDSGSVRLLPVIEADALGNIGKDIQNYIQNEKDHLIQEIVKSDTFNPKKDKDDLPSSSSNPNLISRTSKMYLNGRFPVVLNDWADSYSLPWWFTEQPDSIMRSVESQIPDMIEDGLYKKSRTEEFSDDVLKIPIKLNGSIIFDIPKQIVNYFRNASCMQSQIFTDYKEEQCHELINISNNQTIQKKLNQSNNSFLNSANNQNRNITLSKSKENNSESIPSYIQYLPNIDNYYGDYSSSYQSDIISRNKIYDQLFVCQSSSRYSSSSCDITDTSQDTTNQENVQKIYSFFHDVHNHENSTKSPLYGIQSENLVEIPEIRDKNFISNSSKCQMNLDRGSCIEIFERYYYDIIIGECVQFIYTGCGGNMNNFFTKEECENICIKVIVENSIHMHSESHSSQKKIDISRLSKNATMTFVVEKIWTKDMDGVDSLKRNYFWKEIEAELEYAYENEYLIIPQLTSISKYHDGYNKNDFIQVYVQLSFENDTFESIKQPWLIYVINKNQSSSLALSVLPETVTIIKDESLLSKTCRKMDIPFVSVCNDTLYGCCEDGVMIASGPKKQGCPEINCPCDEILVSFVLDLSNKQIEELGDESVDEKTLIIFNQLVDAINATYSNQVIDAYIDSRKCQAHIMNQPIFKQVIIIDMAFKFSIYLFSPIEPILKLSKTNKIGNLPIIPNSLIVTGAYGKSENFKSRRTLITHIKPFNKKNENPFFYLSFNEIIENIVPDISGNGNNFELSGSHSNIKRRTLSEIDIVQNCGGIFYPKRNEIATLQINDQSKLFPTMKEMTLSFWFMPLKDILPVRKNDIISMVSEPNNSIERSIEIINPFISLNGRNLSTTWGDVECSSQLSSLEINKWIYIAVYYNMENRSIDFYQNGKKISSCYKPQTLEAVESNLSLKKIILGDKSYPVNGPIDEITMYSQKLSDEKILYNYEKCKNVNTFGDNKENSCNRECPPPLKNKTKKIDKDRNKPKPIGTCLQYKNRCNRNKNGIYKMVLPSHIFDTQPFFSPFRSLSTYCDMEEFGGGWTLIFSNPIKSIWKPEELYSRNINHPSIFEQFSILKFADSFLENFDNFEYMIKISSNNKTFGLINSLANKNISFVSKFPTDDEIILVKKFGDWNYFSSSLGQRFPWIMYILGDDNNRYPILTASVDQIFKEGILLDTINNTQKLLSLEKSNETEVITYWYRESNQNSTYGGFIDVSGIEAEISAYYLSAEIINLENYTVIIEYYLGGSKQFIKIAAKNSSTVFTVIQSITMPISVSMRAEIHDTHENLYMNCRMDLNVPVFYLKDDLYIITISKDCEALYPELKEYYYDYIIYNSVSEPVVLEIQILNITSTFVMDAKSFDDWKGSVIYLKNPNFEVSVKTARTNRQLYINNLASWNIKPTDDKHKISKVQISETTEETQRIDIICYYSFDIVNDAIITLDVTWREDILLAVIDPGERISITFKMLTNFDDLKNNKADIQVYSHDMKLQEIVKTYINGKDRETISCDAQKISKLIILTTNATDLKSLRTDIKNKKITLEQREEQLCPPVIHGGYSPWSNWSECIGSCPDNGKKYRFRVCNNPTPENGGLSCIDQGLGSDIETQPCQLKYCLDTFNTTQYLDFKIPNYGNSEKKINLILELVNSFEVQINVQIYIYNILGKGKKYINSSIKGLMTKNIVLNDSIIQKNSIVKIFAQDPRNIRVKVGGKDELSLGFHDQFKKVTILIGNITDINTLKYYINVRFINNAGTRARIVFERSHISFNMVKYIEQESILVLKTKINSMVSPGHYKIISDSGEGTYPLYLNGQTEFVLYPFINSKDLQIVVINERKNNYQIIRKFINLMFVNSIKESIKLKLSSVYGNDFVRVEGGKVKFYEMIIYTPIEIFLSISPMSQQYNNQSIYIDSLPNVTYVAENYDNNIRLYNIAQKENVIDMANYFVKMRIVNLASQPAGLIWRENEPLFILEGHESRINFNIVSSIRPPALVITGMRKNGSLCFVNGRQSTYVIPSKTQTDYITVLLSEVSDYTMSNNDFIDISIKIINTLNMYVNLKWGWSEEQSENVIVDPLTVFTHFIQSPASDPLVFLAQNILTNETLIVNGTTVFGIMPAQLTSNFTLLISSGVFIRKIGLKILNENLNDDIEIIWKYEEQSSVARIPRNSGVDLKLRLHDLGINSSIIISLRNPTSNLPICAAHSHDNLIISANIIEQLARVTQNGEYAWIILPLPKVKLINSQSCQTFLPQSLNIEDDFAKLVTLKIITNITDDVYLRWNDGQLYHSIYISPKDASLLVFLCFDHCPQTLFSLSSRTKEKNSILLNGNKYLDLPYSSEFSTQLNPIFILMVKTNQTDKSNSELTYKPVIVNTMNEPVILFWRLQDNETEKVVLPNYGSVPLFMNITNKESLKLLMYAISNHSQNKLLVNGYKNYSIDRNLNCSSSCESSDQIVIHPQENNIFTSKQDVYKFTFENRLLKSVFIEVNPGDKLFEIEPLGISVFEIDTGSSSKEVDAGKIIINAYDKINRYPLKLNESSSGLVISRKEYPSQSFYIIVKPPDLSIIPTHSYVFNSESIKEMEENSEIEIHGPVDYSSIYIYKSAELQGVTLDGSKRWLGINVPNTNCLVYPNQCQEGLSYAVRIKLPINKIDSDFILKIVDTGNDGSSTSGVSLYLKGNKLMSQITSTSRTWQVSKMLYNENEILVIVTWNQEEGLAMYINGSLASTDSAGETVLSAPNIEMSPNILIGRGFNKIDNLNNKFVIFSLIIFQKYLREKEAKATYLYLVSNKLSNAIITNLRVVNDFGRVIRLIPNKGIVPSTGLIIKPGKKYQILSLIDFYSKDPSEKSSFSFERSVISSQKLSLYAEDYEYGIPLYINNRPSPYNVKSDKKDDYVDIVISSKTPEIYPIYHWALTNIIPSMQVVSKTFPVVKYFGNVVLSKNKNSGLSLDGFGASLQIGDLPYRCIFSPNSCDRGVSVMIEVLLEESLGGTDNTLKFILDTGGHHGEGFSIYLLGGRIVVEVSLNRQIWKLESGIPYGENLILILVWDPKNGGTLELYSNGKLLEKISKSAEKQGFSNLRNQTLYIGTSSVKSANENFEGARFSIKLISIFDQALDKMQVLYEALYYWNHNQPINHPRYINTNFENRAGVDVVVRPDKGEHKDDGYTVNSGLMLELRLEEKGPITTYPVIFKAYALNNRQSLLISGESSLLVLPEEEQSRTVNTIITSKLKCIEPDGLFRDPSDKSSYITCQDGIAMRQKCPPESFWDEDIKSCKLSSSVYFKNKSTNTSTESTKYSSFNIMAQNKESFEISLNEKNYLFSSIKIPPFGIINKTISSRIGTLFSIYSSFLNETYDKPILINGQKDLTFSNDVNGANILIEISRKTNSFENLNDKTIKNETKSTSYELNKNKTEEIYTSTEMPLFGEKKIIRFAFLASNLVDQRIRFFEKNNQINSFEMKPNQTARVFLEGEAIGNSVIFLAQTIERNHRNLKINGLDEIKISVSILNKISPPVGAIVIHDSNQGWMTRRDLLLKMIKEFQKSNPEYKSLFLRIYKTFTDDGFITENSGSGLHIKLKKSDSLIDKTALDVSIRVLKETKIIKLSSFLQLNNQSILINGVKEYIVHLNDSIIQPVALIVHLPNQNWNIFFKKIEESLAEKFENNIKRLNQENSPYIFNQDMVFIVSAFINVANTDARIRSISGPLLIDTVFPKSTTSRITMWIPLNTRVELIAMDKTGNILLLNGNSSIIIDSKIYSKKPYYITNSNSSDDLSESSTSDNNDDSSITKFSSIFKIKNNLNHNNIKFFVIGRQNPSDIAEKVFSFPSTDHLIFDQPLHDKKIFAVDSLSGNLLSINGKPYFQEKSSQNMSKKDFLTELIVESLIPDQNENIQQDDESEQKEMIRNYLNQ